MRAADLANINKPPNICIVGRAGCGKTALVSQAGEGAFLADFDGGMRTALTLQDKFTPRRQAIEFEEFYDENPYEPRGYARFKIMLQSWLKEPKQVPRAFVIDSLTGLKKSLIRYIMKGAGHAFKQPEIQHWGTMITELEQILFILRSLPCMTLMTAHDGFVEGTDSNGKTQIMQIINSITRNHGRNELAWLFDEVLYMKSRSLATGLFKATVTAKSVGDLPIRTRSGIFKDLDIVETGLDGILEQVGFSYK